MKNSISSIVFSVVSIVCLCLSAIFLIIALNTGKSTINVGAQSSDTTAVTTASDTEAVADDKNGAEPKEEPPVKPGESIPENIYLNIVTFLQMPELPNGCEIVSLATVLRHLGYNIDKCEFAREYLPCGPVGKTAPDIAYVGDPFSGKTGTAFGCLAPVITRAANKFFDDNGGGYYAVNLTGTPIKELETYLAAGIPIIMWATLEMRSSPVTATWNINGTKYSWLTYSHCTVLSGYTGNDYIFSDPLYDLVSYPKDAVEAAYKAQYMQAVAILKTPIE